MQGNHSTLLNKLFLLLLLLLIPAVPDIAAASNLAIHLLTKKDQANYNILD